MVIEGTYKDLLGRPCVVGSDDEHTPDCKLLVRIVYERAGIELPPGALPTTIGGYLLDEETLEEFVERFPWKLLGNEPHAATRSLDIIVTHDPRWGHHIGIVVSPGWIITSNTERGVHLRQTRSLRRCVGVYRLKGGDQ